MRNNKFKLLTCFLIIISILLVDTSLNAFAASVTKAEYTMKKDKVTYKDNNGKVRGIVFFQYPVIKGETGAAKKINDVLKKESKAYMQNENAETLKEYAEAAIDNNGFYSEDEQYYYKTNCNVTYNDNSIISLHMKNGWYAGGVYNQTDFGYTFDLKSGDKLELKDVASGNPTTIKNNILAAAKKYLTSNSDFDKKAYDYIRSCKLKDYKFYLSKGKVYICFESYELGRGNGWDIFSIKSKY
ncbi:protein of unknown function [Anaerocolumna jejuensis DSM 15929]|uniref:Deacetylase PdaC domain-containing protein n=1 Tax=Anaerocolumna jejuensis DSM 15929 TaxID=1121322 RepID=A0A1M6YC54_9FIRM|nr:DUF4163 domain-containing protein [Anaerocolumna jejuensis]SHL15529.1 protein of unknown function [Anaerocolumna jejuensis DSM 15929]